MLNRRGFLLSSGAFFALGAFGAGFRLGKKVVIAHVSDVHVSTEDKAAGIRKVIAEINADPEIDFVAVTGDLQNRGQLGELQVARGWYDLIEKPKFVCPGNHEMQYAGSRENWAKAFGEAYCRGRFGDIPVYSVDSTPPGYQTPGFFRPEEMKRLTADLVRDGAKDAPLTVILTHYSPTFELLNWWLLPEALKAAGVTNALILSGHIHRHMAFGWLGYLGFAGRAVGLNALHKDHAGAGYVRLTVGTDGVVTAEERVAGGTTYPAEYSDRLAAGKGKRAKNVSSPKYRPVPPPAGATEVRETGVIAFPPPFDVPREEMRLRKRLKKGFSGKRSTFGVSPCCSIVSDGGRLYVPGSRGTLLVLDEKTHRELKAVKCGYSTIVGLEKKGSELHLALAEGRSFVLQVEKEGAEK